MITSLTFLQVPKFKKGGGGGREADGQEGRVRPRFESKIHSAARRANNFSRIQYPSTF